MYAIACKRSRPYHRLLHKGLSCIGIVFLLRIQRLHSTSQNCHSCTVRFGDQFHHVSLVLQHLFLHLLGPLLLELLQINVHPLFRAICHTRNDAAILEELGGGKLSSWNSSWGEQMMLSRKSLNSWYICKQKGGPSVVKVHCARSVRRVVDVSP